MARSPPLKPACLNASPTPPAAGPATQEPELISRETVRALEVSDPLAPGLTLRTAKCLPVEHCPFPCIYS